MRRIARRRRLLRRCWLGDKTRTWGRGAGPTRSTRCPARARSQVWRLPADRACFSIRGSRFLAATNEHGWRACLQVTRVVPRQPSWGGVYRRKPLALPGQLLPYAVIAAWQKESLISRDMSQMRCTCPGRSSCRTVALAACLFLGTSASPPRQPTLARRRWRRKRRMALRL